MSPDTMSPHEARCAYVYIDNNSHEFPCKHPCYRTGRYCVFHDADLGGKSTDFHQTFESYVSLVSKDALLLGFDFRGFVFPSIDLAKRVFGKGCDFRKAEFRGDLSCRNTTFHGEADFHRAQFLKKADFQGVNFHQRAQFIGCVFSGRATFSGSKFSKSAVFHGCKFNDFATWRTCKFHDLAVIQETRFNADADFGESVFYAGANFERTSFRQRVDFHGARFHEELRLSEAHLEFLKKLDCKQANLRGAVLHTAQVWENPRLEYYDFRDSILLSVNLSGKALICCDFTGAVFKAVLTHGWRPDRRTLADTKFIYTDCRTSEVRDLDGTVVRKYYPIEESRVPADGFFGCGEHANFTMADYLREPFRWNLALNVPPIFRTAVVNYLQFFSDFMRVTEGIPIEVRTRLEGRKLRVEFLAQTEENLEIVKEKFEEYRRSTGQDFEDLQLRIKFAKDVSEVEKELFLLEYKNTIALLTTKLSLTQALLEEKSKRADLMEEIVRSRIKTPSELLLPSPVLPPKHFDEQVFVLRADLASYTSAIQEDAALEREIAAFLATHKSELEQELECKLVIPTGDGLFVFATSGMFLINAAAKLGGDFNCLKLKYPCPISGFRFVFTYGTLTCTEQGDGRNYSGTAIIEADRIDQPMKDFLQRNKSASNQWCTEAFHAQMLGKHPNLHFEPLPPVALAKDFKSDIRLFQILIS